MRSVTRVISSLPISLGCRKLRVVGPNSGGRGGGVDGGGTDRGLGKRRLLLDRGRRAGGCAFRSRRRPPNSGVGRSATTGRPGATTRASSPRSAARCSFGSTVPAGGRPGRTRSAAMGIGNQGPRRGGPDEIALLDAPWELLARADRPLALDPMQLFIVARRVGDVRSPLAAEHADLQLMFMAAAPQGQHELDFEAEEAAILEATKRLPLRLVVEETGNNTYLGERLTSDEGPFEALHLSCHGDNDPALGPILLLEDPEGGEDRSSPGAIVEALGADPPPLVFLSACRRRNMAAGRRAEWEANRGARPAKAGADPTSRRPSRGNWRPGSPTGRAGPRSPPRGMRQVARAGQSRSRGARPRAGKLAVRSAGRAAHPACRGRSGAHSRDADAKRRADRGAGGLSPGARRRALGLRTRGDPRSRLLLTSRYDVRLPDGRGNDRAAGLVRVPLRPMDAR